MMGVREGEESCLEKKRKRWKGGEKVDNREIIWAANNKFCPHHTSAERGQPLLMALLISGFSVRLDGMIEYY
jgi:hypothetical protein